MFEHLFQYQLNIWQLLLMTAGVILAFAAGKMLNKKQKLKKGITLFFAISVFILDYFSYAPGWNWVIEEHSTWHYFTSWIHVFSFFEFLLLPFDLGFLLSWIKMPKKFKNCKLM